MAARKLKGLGRGLDALLGPSVSDAAPTPAGTPMMAALGDLRPGRYQPRTRMDEGALYELAESIKAQGIMQPILVRRVTSGDAKSVDGGKTERSTGFEFAPTYEIIAGERRFRAAGLAGLTEVPVLVRDVADEDAAAMALIENIQREDLNPLEEAQGIQRLLDEFALTHEQAAQAIGRSRSAASNLLRLLQLSEPVQTMLMAGDIDMGHARALLTLPGGQQITIANQVAARRLSVRQTEALVRKLAQDPGAGDARKASRAAAKSGDVRRVEEALSDRFTAPVEVRLDKLRRGRGPRHQSGELAIRFSSLEELNGLIERLQKA
ncbi:MAG: ParB/RepB/Spo0J family partition protein [Rhodanobacteraceae bacterium]|jgi:ParB family chromosome partitioning protein|nr:MAG: ParB/RepB/Spo0J family partition protein [Rhodanobacteraceae bacterium]